MCMVTWPMDQSRHRATGVNNMPTSVPPSRRIRAYSVHLLTASGVVISGLIASSIWAGAYRNAFLLMIAAVLIDAIDGPLARLVRVHDACPEIDGRKLDDLVDYLNYTFLPIMLLCHANWLPHPVMLWAAAPLLASLFGFAHSGAKEDQAGFFRGFPSYWNIVVFYVAVWLHRYGPWPVLAVVLLLSLLTVVPIHMIYPNRAPRWRGLFVGGSGAWLVTLIVLLVQYPDVSDLWIGLSLVYPAFYVAASVYLAAACHKPRSQDA